MTLRWLILMLVPSVAACSPQAALQNPSSTNANVPTSTTTTTIAPMVTSVSEPTPMASDLVWFAPNFGSRDYTDLFTKPELWSETRVRINVFKFYTQNMLDQRCSICGGNTLKAFVEVDAFRQLNEWGIAIGIEVGAVKEWGCNGNETFRVASTVIQNIKENGGTVAFVDMDEPYIGGELVANDQSCGYTMEQSANGTARFVQLMNSSYPNILVGDTEPYPYFSVSELEQWIGALEDRDVTLAHFHLDVDMLQARSDNEDVFADLQTLSQFFQERHIPFGVILTSNTNWVPNSDRAFFDATMNWIRTVNAALDKPQHVIFQSWQGPSANGIHEFPINLPEDDPDTYSLTRLVIEGLEMFEP